MHTSLGIGLRIKSTEIGWRIELEDTFTGVWLIPPWTVHAHESCSTFLSNSATECRREHTMSSIFFEFGLGDGLGVISVPMVPTGALVTLRWDGRTSI
ncbi:hypothetical protein SCLCIDRAFT_849034 [Scleroderma citrinum Foug A]|uniref:Uncharacterized protein n=1 Tax=Scleroderma citrinum Foug A TaxID=1036808 RepID=A0A0C2ZKQ8_9AGAM|nr:hypothetical protein SCLCIDRAFT_849034 [Scleroderma citrinum Foug A]